MQLTLLASYSIDPGAGGLDEVNRMPIDLVSRTVEGC
jgi:hypothetical protein